MDWIHAWTGGRRGKHEWVGGWKGRWIRRMEDRSVNDKRLSGSFLPNSWAKNALLSLPDTERLHDSTCGSSKNRPCEELSYFLLNLQNVLFFFSSSDSCPCSMLPSEGGKSTWEPAVTLLANLFTLLRASAITKKEYPFLYTTIQLWPSLGDCKGPEGCFFLDGVKTLIR